MLIGSICVGKHTLLLLFELGKIELGIIIGLVLEEGWLSCWKHFFGGKGGTALVFDAVAVRETVAFGGGFFLGWWSNSSTRREYNNKTRLR